MAAGDRAPQARGLQFLLQAVLVLAFVTGGSSQLGGWDDAVVQLLALPLLAWALWVLPTREASALGMAAIAVAAAVMFVPAVQLLPLPAGGGSWPGARDSLARDIATAGATLSASWTLDRAATEQAALFLLAPLAVFLATLGVGLHAHRGLLRLVMVLVIASLFLAFLQLGVPRESVLNPYPQWAHQFNGIFANQNHQGIALVVAIVIALALLLERTGEGGRVAQGWRTGGLVFLVVFAICALPLTGSRASVLMAVLAVGLVPLSMGLFDRRHLRRGWAARLGLVACLALIALGAWGTFAWMQVDVVDELRAPIRKAAFALGSQYAPWGAGVGAFVPAFEQGAPPSLLLPNFINHAHNEFANWWVEAGWLAVVVGLAVAALLASCIAGAWRRSSGGDRAVPVAATLGVLALLAHSWVDYPLRTPALACVAAVLVGILVARASVKRRRTPVSAIGA